MSDPETPLEMTARHVDESVARIAAHGALIKRLEAVNPNSTTLPAARLFLAELRRFHQTAIDHLARLLAEERTPDDA